MARAPGERIHGIETEFGCLVAEKSFGDPETAVEQIKDHLFYEMRVGAIDLSARDEVFEPARSGGFLINGGRLYVDAVGSHLEYATAECRSIKDLIANDRAGQRLIVRALDELGLSETVRIYNNSIDHFGGHTFGCHENYLVEMDENFFSFQAPYLYPFLVTRQIYAGVGRVGGHAITRDAARPSYDDVVRNPEDYIWVSHVYAVLPDPTVRYQLSQRADHIIKTVASRVRFNRALINPKWEHYYNHDGMHRLHLLFGEANQSEYAYALKVGATGLVLRLIEDHLIPADLVIADPLDAIRAVSRDQTYRWRVVMASGEERSAVDIQRQYLRMAERYAGQSAETDWVLREWDQVLQVLEEDPMALADRIDWVAKKRILEEYMRETGVGWDDDSLHSVDLEYHNVSPSQSLFYALQESGEMARVVDDLQIVDAMTEPPQDTRALGRSLLIRRALERRAFRAYAFDWSGAATDRHTYVDMSDPFDTYADKLD